MNHTYDIIAVGECLIDFVGGEKDGKFILEGNPGGAPTNVLAMASQLGLSTAIVTKVGNDSFGAFLRKNVSAVGINTDFMVEDLKYPTTLAIVSLDETGNRSFSFYRGQTADVMLSESEVPYAEIENAKILHYGSVSLTHQSSRAATFSAARYAKAHDVMVSYDPNLRPLLWDSLETAKAVIQQGLSLADVAKLSDEELLFLTDAHTLEEGIEQLYAKYSLRLLAVTLGSSGCICRSTAGTFRDKAFNVPCVDTTGAGDAFWGASLSYMLQSSKPIEQYTADDMHKLMSFANAAGSLATTQKGAIPAMPTLQKIEHCIQTIPRL
ncbi:carbohydrate kinase family protein [Acetanaerobacterium elongatum]|uniref:Fructokinase n=1 Tax=Acetanaerobacterium elongatum TaxID=258515 RepID=A0A1G9USK7_9FIRM|nr:carbohydrate kinase [Acetanaerobacterium elongatum]SDM62883.1 fructokinase [Acetanaerobacterium elongatum]